MITFLQHTDPLLPHYKAEAWTFPRGALCTVDRSWLGPVGPYLLHGIAEWVDQNPVSSKDKRFTGRSLDTDFSLPPLLLLTFLQDSRCPPRFLQDSWVSDSPSLDILLDSKLSLMLCFPFFPLDSSLQRLGSHRSSEDSSRTSLSIQRRQHLRSSLEDCSQLQVYRRKRAGSILQKRSRSTKSGRLRRFSI